MILEPEEIDKINSELEEISGESEENSYEKIAELRMNLCRLEGEKESLESEIEFHKTLGCKVCGIGSMPGFDAKPETIDNFV